VEKSCVGDYLYVWSFGCWSCSHIFWSCLKESFLGYCSRSWDIDFPGEFSTMCLGTNSNIILKADCYLMILFIVSKKTRKGALANPLSIKRMNWLIILKLKKYEFQSNSEKLKVLYEYEKIKKNKKIIKKTPNKILWSFKCIHLCIINNEGLKE